MSGYVKDPRVGRDVLLGCVVAIAMTTLEVLYNVLPPLIGRPPAVPVFQANVGALTGSGALASVIFDQTVGGIFVGMFAVLGYVLLRLALRRTSFAVAAAVVLLAIVQAQSVLNSAAPLWLAVLFQVGIIGIITTVVVRYGLLVTVVVFAVGNVLGAVPLTTVAVALGVNDVQHHDGGGDRADAVRVLRVAGRSAAVRELGNGS